ncbi:neurensin-2 isoform X2 [Paroedura picta]
MAATCDPSCGCHWGPNAERGKWYGVHSYLHLFYEDCARACPDDDPELAAPPASIKWNAVLWKVTFSAGTLLLLLGAAALATGFIVPPKLEGIGAEDFVVLDQQAVEHNHALGLCRAVGTVLCAIAGALLVTCAVSSALARANRGRKQGGEVEEEPGTPLLQENPPGEGNPVGAGASLPFQASWVQSIQPKAETKPQQGVLGDVSTAPAWKLSSDLASGD